MSRYKEYPAATLIVDRWHTTCNNCGRECTSSEDKHDTILGYGPDNGSEGCGIVWTHITSDYIGPYCDRENLQAMRPDLTYIDPLASVDL